MVFHCVTTCSKCVISQTEYLFLSQQSAMSVRKRVGFLSPNWIYELVWDSESEEAGASSDSIIYLGNRILRIFRQPLKYLCFSYSFLDGARKYHVDSRFPIMKNILETITQVSIVEHHSTNIGLSRFVMVLSVNSEWCEKSCHWSVEEVWCVCV
jgi:catabolite regulation protein CreA